MFVVLFVAFDLQFQGISSLRAKLRAANRSSLTFCAAKLTKCEIVRSKTDFTEQCPQNGYFHFFQHAKRF